MKKIIKVLISVAVVLLLVIAVYWLIMRSQAELY